MTERQIQVTLSPQALLSSSRTQEGWTGRTVQFSLSLPQGRENPEISKNYVYCAIFTKITMFKEFD